MNTANNIKAAGLAVSACGEAIRPGRAKPATARPSEAGIPRLWAWGVVNVLANLGGYDAAGLARPIANLVLSLPEPAPSPVRLDQEALRRISGIYAGLVETLEVGYDGQQLSVAGDIEGKLIPLSETVFTLADDADTTICFDDLDADSFQWARAVVPFYWFNARRVD